ncbi:MAG: hypothetical protein JSW07_09490, partial [bacterium]
MFKFYNRKKYFAVSFLIVFFMAYHMVIAGEDESLKTEIVNAINKGANYACDVLLDEDGKSRCDYHILEGRWYDYEPPWHTGQI